MRQIFVLLILAYSLGCSAEAIKYHINNMFSISVSDKMEMRKDDDAYTKLLKNDVFEYSSDDRIVFQQKGLAGLDHAAMARYARIIIRTEVDEDGEFPAFNDADIPQDVVDELERACSMELAQGQYFLAAPKGNVEETGKGVRININYRRSGTQGAVNVRIIYIFNYRYAAKIVASYRESEESIWKAAIEQAINSIEWDETFIVESLDDVTSQQGIEDRPSDINMAIIQSLAGVFIMMVCVLFTYLLYRTKRVERKIKRNRRLNKTAEPMHAHDEVAAAGRLSLQRNLGAVCNK